MLTALFDKRVSNVRLSFCVNSKEKTIIKRYLNLLKTYKTSKIWKIIDVTLYSSAPFTFINYKMKIWKNVLNTKTCIHLRIRLTFSPTFTFLINNKKKIWKIFWMIKPSCVGLKIRFPVMKLVLLLKMVLTIKFTE